MKIRPVTGVVCLMLCILVLAGCASRQIDQETIPPFQEPDLRPEVDVRPRCIPLIEGSDICYDRKDLERQKIMWNDQRQRRAEHLKRNPGSRLHPIDAWDREKYGYMSLNNGETLRFDVWERYLKDFMESLPLEKRHAVLSGLTRHSHEYTVFDNGILFEPLRHSTGPYNRASYIGLVGLLKRNAAAGFVKIRYYGVSSLFIDRFRVVTDGKTYQSPPIDFETDNTAKVREWVNLRLDDPEVRALVERIIYSNKAVIRFQGQHYYQDLVVPDRMKNDMRAMLKAIDVINQ